MVHGGLGPPTPGLVWVRACPVRACGGGPSRGSGRKGVVAWGAGRREQAGDLRRALAGRVFVSVKPRRLVGTEISTKDLKGETGWGPHPGHTAVSSGSGGACGCPGLLGDGAACGIAASPAGRGRGARWGAARVNEAAGAAPAPLQGCEPGPRLGSLQLGGGRNDPLAPGQPCPRGHVGTVHQLRRNGASGQGLQRVWASLRPSPSRQCPLQLRLVAVPRGSRSPDSRVRGPRPGIQPGHGTDRHEPLPGSCLPLPPWRGPSQPSGAAVLPQCTWGLHVGARRQGRWPLPPPAPVVWSRQPQEEEACVSLSSAVCLVPAGKSAARDRPPLAGPQWLLTAGPLGPATGPSPLLHQFLALRYPVLWFLCLEVCGRAAPLPGMPASGIPGLAGGVCPRGPRERGAGGCALAGWSALPASPRARCVWPPVLPTRDRGLRGRASFPGGQWAGGGT